MYHISLSLEWSRKRQFGRHIAFHQHSFMKSKAWNSRNFGWLWWRLWGVTFETTIKLLSTTFIFDIWGWGVEGNRYTEPYGNTNTKTNMIHFYISFHLDGVATCKWETLTWLRNSFSFLCLFKKRLLNRGDFLHSFCGKFEKTANSFRSSQYPP